jgi:hypothetical protein
MVSKTVEVEEEVIETMQEEIIVCDNCGREVDPDGIRLTGNKKKVNYNKKPDKNLDLCSECFQEYKSIRDESERKEELREWWTGKVVDHTPYPHVCETVKTKTNRIIDRFKLFSVISLITYVPVIIYVIFNVSSLSLFSQVIFTLLTVYFAFILTTYDCVRALKHQKERVERKLS